MTISTKDCKDFINSISNIINSNTSDTWKRIKKYKEESLTLRDFENQDGRVLTIAEIQGKLSLHSLYPSQSHLVIMSKPGTQFIGHLVTSKEVCTFIAESIQYDEDVLGNIWEEDVEKTLNDAKNVESWHIWETFFEQDNTIDNYFEENDVLGTKFLLMYADNNGEAIKVDKNDILNIYIVIMGEYSTNYRFTIFETKEHTLLLGNNDSD